MNESRRTNKVVTSHIWMSHGTRMNAWHRTYGWVLANTWLNHATHMHELCHTKQLLKKGFPENSFIHSCSYSFLPENSTVVKLNHSSLASTHLLMLFRSPPHTQRATTLSTQNHALFHTPSYIHVHTHTCIFKAIRHTLSSSSASYTRYSSSPSANSPPPPAPSPPTTSWRTRPPIPPVSIGQVIMLWPAIPQLPVYQKMHVYMCI